MRFITFIKKKLMVFDNKTIKQFNKIMSFADKTSEHNYIAYLEEKIKISIEEKITIQKELKYLKEFVLNEHIKERPKKYTIKQIVDYLGKLYNVDLFEKNRRKKNVDIRSIIYTYVYYKLGLTAQQIANVFNKNHATILFGVKKYKSLTDLKFGDVEFKQLAKRINYDIDAFIKNIENEPPRR